LNGVGVMVQVFKSPKFRNRYFLDYMKRRKYDKVLSYYVGEFL